MARELPPLPEMPIWLQLNKVSKKYMDVLAARLGHLGIRRHYFLLVAIGEGQGSLTQQQLADLIEVDKVAMVGILDSLAKAGFVRRTPTREDRRKRLIALTPKAERALPEIQRTIKELNRLALSGLPGGLSARFPAALLRMKAQLESALHESRPGGPDIRKSRP
jgi:MarR family transcriptional regulator for hemolysin